MKQGSLFKHAGLGLALLLAVWFVGAENALGQYELYLNFHGVVYATNGLGNLAPTYINEHDLLLAAAQSGGRTDTTGLALVYHFSGSSFGDTIEVVDSGSGATLGTLFGFFYGEPSPTTPDRVGITNAPDTQVRHIDHVYTLATTRYTSPNPGGHDMGTGLITRRFMKDSAGNTKSVVDGDFFWLIRPQGSAGTMMCKGKFTTTKPFP